MRKTYFFVCRSLLVGSRLQFSLNLLRFDNWCLQFSTIYNKFCFRLFQGSTSGVKLFPKWSMTPCADHLDSCAMCYKVFLFTWKDRLDYQACPIAYLLAIVMCYKVSMPLLNIEITLEGGARNKTTNYCKLWPKLRSVNRVC